MTTPFATAGCYTHKDRKYRTMDIQKCIDIARLLAKKLTGSITPEENQQLDEWKLADRRHQELADKLTDEKDYLVHQQELEQFPPAERWEQVEQTIRKQNHRSPFATRRWIAAAAAAVLLVLAAGSIYYHYRHTAGEGIQLAALDVPAGTHSAQLVLSNNEIIYLNSDSKCIYNELKGVQIVQESDGVKFLPQQDIPDTLIYNQIRTLQGMEYHITLGEGTKIFMNAQSTLTHPLAFRGKERLVKFEGEAYFEVAKDSKHPFVIELGDKRLQVLGTSFNVHAYPDEDLMQITLESGALKMDGTRIRPGEQIVYDRKSHELTVHAVDTKEFVAWHEGHFLFRNERLEDILRTLSRWYSFDYDFADQAARDVRFGAYLSRYDNMKTIINMLQRTGLVNVAVKDGKLLFGIP